jgi:hypothetical protein
MSIETTALPDDVEQLKQLVIARKRTPHTVLTTVG